MLAMGAWRRRRRTNSMRTQLAPDFFQFAQTLRVTIQNETPSKQPLDFHCGQSYGL